MTIPVIAGYTFEELAQLQSNIRRDAAAFVATELAKAEALFGELITTPYGSEKMLQVAGEAAKAFENVRQVSVVCGVTYCIPWDTGWGDGDEYTSKLDNYVYNASGSAYENRREEIRALYRTLCFMEQDSKGWNDSSC